MKVKTNQKQILHLNAFLSIPEPLMNSESSFALIEALKSLKKSKNIIVGINSVNRKMVQQKVKILVLSNDLNPPEIIQHLLIMSRSSGIPVLSTTLNKKQLGECLQLRSASVVGILDSAPNDMIELLQPFSTKIPHENLAYPIIETDVFIPNRKH